MQINLVRAALIAASFAASTVAQAQVVTRTQGTTTNYTSIQSEVLGSQMGGMRVSATYEGCSTNGCTTGGLLTASGIWQQYGSSWGVNLMNGNTQLGTVRIGQNTNTFDGNYTFDWTPGNDFRTLTFEGGVGFGNVIFDIASETGCGAPTITCAGQTTNSSTGNAFDIESGFDYNNGVLYTNAVSYNGESLKYDAFTKVTMTFDIDASGPDSDQTPFTFQMDTDLGANVSTVPEPSTYALMAAGLAGVFGFARRRRNNA